MMFNRQPLELYSIDMLKANTFHPQHLITLHTISGCDSVSSLYGIGKKKALDAMRAIDDYSHLDKFLNINSTPSDIEEAGEWLILKLYGAVRCESLDRLRYIKQARIAGQSSLSKTFNLASLPPTSGAAKYHSHRTYHAVQQCLGHELSPLDWGWSLTDGQLSPVTTDLEVAPEKVLKKASCGCKTDCNKRCKCRKENTPCSVMCSNCRGETCTNPEVYELEEELLTED